MATPGANAGIGGTLVDISINGGGNASAIFRATVTGYIRELTQSPINAAGRGDGNFPESRPGDCNGSIVLSGIEPLDGWPMPVSLTGQTGTLTRIVDQGQTPADVKKETSTVRVTGQTVALDKKSNDQPQIKSLVLSILNNPTLVGWPGTQPNPSAPTFSTPKELWAETVKSIDFNSLQDSSQQHWLYWGADDNDIAETSAINDVMSTYAAAPFDGQKMRVATGQRISSKAYLITVTFGRRDTIDDVQMPATVTHDDQDSIQDNATICRVTVSSTPPSTPSAPVGELVAIDSNQLDDSFWRHTFQYANTGPLNRIKFDGSPIDADASSLEDTDVQVLSNTSSTPPSTPSPRITDLQLRRRTSIRHTSTPVLWIHTFYFSRNTRKDDIELGGTVTANDPNDLEESAEITQVTNSATAPSTPSAPLGTINEIITAPITKPNGSYTGYWKHTFKYSSFTNLERVQSQGGIETDPNSLEDGDIQTQVGSSSTAPSDPATRVSGLKLIKREGHRIGGTPEKWEWKYYFGRRNGNDGITFPGTIWHKDAVESPQGKSTLIISHNSGDTMQAIVESWYTSNWNSTADFAGVSARRITDTLSILEVTKRKDSVETVIYTQTRVDSLRTYRTIGADFGKVYVADVQSIATSMSNVRVDFVSMFRETGRLTVKRRIKATKDVDVVNDAITHDSLKFLRGKVGEYIVGLPAERFLYSGHKIVANYTDSGYRWFDVDYFLDYDSASWLIDEAVTPGWYRVNSSMVAGLVAASTFGWTIGTPTIDSGGQLKTAFLV